MVKRLGKISLLYAVMLCIQIIFASDAEEGSDAANEDCDECPVLDTCGIAKSTFCNYRAVITKLIKSPLPVGGLASFGKWPWLVVMALKEETGVPFCLATLLSNTWAITATCCFTEHSKDEFELQFGQHKTDKEDEPLPVETRDIISYKRECDDPPPGDCYLAMIGFSRVEYSFSILNLCLPDNMDAGYENHGSEATVAGWAHFDEENPSSLHDLTVKIMRHDQCKALLYKSNAAEKAAMLTDHHLCSFEDQSGLLPAYPVCHGETGSPIMHQQHGSNWVLIGVQTNITYCAGDSLPAVYARVGRHLDFINKTLEEEPS